jgi:hypothetical protein
MCSITREKHERDAERQRERELRAQEQEEARLARQAVRATALLEKSAAQASAQVQKAARVERAAKMKALRGLSTLQLRAVIEAMGGQPPVDAQCGIQALRETVIQCEGWSVGHTLPDGAVEASQRVSVKLAALNNMSTAEMRAELRKHGADGSGTGPQIKLRLFPYLANDGSLPCLAQEGNAAEGLQVDCAAMEDERIGDLGAKAGGTTQSAPEEAVEMSTMRDSPTGFAAEAEQAGTDSVEAEVNVEADVKAQELEAVSAVDVEPVSTETTENQATVRGQRSRRRPRQLFDYALLGIVSRSGKDTREEVEEESEEEGVGKRRKVVLNYKEFAARGVR